MILRLFLSKTRNKDVSCTASLTDTESTISPRSSTISSKGKKKKKRKSTSDGTSQHLPQGHAKVNGKVDTTRKPAAVNTTIPATGYKEKTKIQKNEDNDRPYNGYIQKSTSLSIPTAYTFDDDDFSSRRSLSSEDVSCAASLTDTELTMSPGSSAISRKAKKKKKRKSTSHGTCQQLLSPRASGKGKIEKTRKSASLNDIIPLTGYKKEVQQDEDNNSAYCGYIQKSMSLPFIGTSNTFDDDECSTKSVSKKKKKASSSRRKSTMDIEGRSKQKRSNKDWKRSTSLSPIRSDTKKKQPTPKKSDKEATKNNEEKKKKTQGTKKKRLEREFTIESTSGDLKACQTIKKDKSDDCLTTGSNSQDFRTCSSNTADEPIIDNGKCNHTPSSDTSSKIQKSLNSRERSHKQKRSSMTNKTKNRSPKKSKSELTSDNNSSDKHDIVELLASIPRPNVWDPTDDLQIEGCDRAHDAIVTTSADSKKTSQSQLSNECTGNVSSITDSESTNSNSDVEDDCLFSFILSSEIHDLSTQFQNELIQMKKRIDSVMQEERARIRRDVTHALTRLKDVQEKTLTDKKMGIKNIMHDINDERATLHNQLIEQKQEAMEKLKEKNDCILLLERKFDDLNLEQIALRDTMVIMKQELKSLNNDWEEERTELVSKLEQKDKRIESLENEVTKLQLQQMQQQEDAQQEMQKHEIQKTLHRQQRSSIASIDSSEIARLSIDENDGVSRWESIVGSPKQTSRWSSGSIMSGLSPIDVMDIYKMDSLPSPGAKNPRFKPSMEEKWNRFSASASLPFQTSNFL